MIAFEGPDNAGKSTIAKHLATKYDLHYYTAGPAPKSVNELDLCLVNQWIRRNIPGIQDRLTCISQQVYSETSDLISEKAHLVRMINTPKFVVVYCRPPERVLMDFSTHKLKSYDTEESLSKIVSNQHRYINKYDLLMQDIPHYTYDWTDEDLNLEKFMDDLVATQFDKNEWNLFRKQVAITGLPI